MIRVTCVHRTFTNCFTPLDIAEDDEVEDTSSVFMYFLKSKIA